MKASREPALLLGHRIRGRALRDAVLGAQTRLLRGYSALPISSPVVDPLATALAPRREPTLDGMGESLGVGDVR